MKILCNKNANELIDDWHNEVDLTIDPYWSQITAGSHYHGQFFSIGCRNTVGCVSSHVTLVAHEHDGNILRGHVLPRKK